MRRARGDPQGRGAGAGDRACAAQARGSGAADLPIRLRCEPERAAPLAQLVHEKTAGNPFFAIQFLTALAEEGLLAFDHDRAAWSWDLERIHAKGYTDNVVDLMVGKLHRLPATTQNALQQLACLGNSAEFATLAIVHGGHGGSAARGAVGGGPSRAGRASGGRLPVRARPRPGGGLFADPGGRARRGPSADRPAARAHTPAEKRSRRTIFEIVSQLNRGAALITSA